MRVSSVHLVPRARKGGRVVVARRRSRSCFRLGNLSTGDEDVIVPCHLLRAGPSSPTSTTHELSYIIASVLSSVGGLQASITIQDEQFEEIEQLCHLSLLCFVQIHLGYFPSIPKDSFTQSCKVIHIHLSSRNFKTPYFPGSPRKSSQASTFGGGGGGTSASFLPCALIFRALSSLIILGREGRPVN
jgi:hypothetical protein